MKYDYLIVGSGLFGATFADLATKAGKSCLVVEKRNHIGGNIYTEDIDNINIHKYGAHIFHTSNKSIWNYIKSFSVFNNFINSPLAIYNNEIYNLPFNMNTFSKLWNIKTPEEAKQIISAQVKQASITHPKNLREQAISLVGIDIFSKLIDGYTRKQWNTPCEELSPDIIKRIPVRFTYNNNYFDDIYQGIPVNGYTPIIERMLSGSKVILNEDYLAKKTYYNSLAKRVIYTGTIDSYFNYCYGKLKYRSLEFKTSKLNISDFQGNAVINYTSFDIPYTRIIEHKHFQANLDINSLPHTIITREYPKDWTDNAEPFYPVGDKQSIETYEKYVKLAAELDNIYFGGRLGQYKYFDMDDTILSAFELYNKIKGE